MLASARSTRKRHSANSDHCTQSRTDPTVRATPIAVSPFGANAQSSAARTLSIQWPNLATHSAVGLASASACAWANRFRKYSAWLRATWSNSPLSMSFVRAYARVVLEQSILRRAAGNVHRDERLGHEICHAVQDLGRGELRNYRRSWDCRHCARRIKREAAGKDREPTQQHPFGISQ